MRVAMQKVDGVQGVRVSLNEGLTVLDLKPGNTVTVAALRQIIKNNGFVSKEVQVIAKGTAITADGKSIFEVSVTQERVPLSSAPERTGDAWRFTVPAPSK